MEFHFNLHGEDDEFPIDHLFDAAEDDIHNPVYTLENVMTDQTPLHVYNWMNNPHMNLGKVATVTYTSLRFIWLHIPANVWMEMGFGADFVHLDVNQPNIAAGVVPN